MALPKYKLMFKEMIEDNQELFDELKSLSKDNSDFPAVQRKAVRIVYQTQSALCNRSDSTKFNMYSTGLAEKFIELVREHYPEIDYSL